MLYTSVSYSPTRSYKQTNKQTNKQTGKQMTIKQTLHSEVNGKNKLTDLLVLKNHPVCALTTLIGCVDMLA